MPAPKIKPMLYSQIENIVTNSEDMRIDIDWLTNRENKNAIVLQNDIKALQEKVIAMESEPDQTVIYVNYDSYKSQDFILKIGERTISPNLQQGIAKIEKEANTIEVYQHINEDTQLLISFETDLNHSIYRVEVPFLESTKERSLWVDAIKFNGEVGDSISMMSRLSMLPYSIDTLIGGQSVWYDNGTTVFPYAMVLASRYKWFFSEDKKYYAGMSGRLGLTPGDADASNEATQIGFVGVIGRSIKIWGVNELQLGISAGGGWIGHKDSSTSANKTYYVFIPDVGIDLDIIRHIKNGKKSVWQVIIGSTTKVAIIPISRKISIIESTGSSVSYHIVGQLLLGVEFRF